MSKDLLNLRIFLLGLFIFWVVVFHINVRIQVVSLGYELSNLRSELDRLKKKETETEFQKEKIMSVKALIKLLQNPHYASFERPKPEQVVFIKSNGP
jgi:hypothetical protein